MKSVKMIVTNGFDPDVRVLKEAEYLAQKLYDVEILCWDRENRYINQPTEDIGKVRVRRFFPKSRYGSGLKQIRPFLHFVRECKKYLKSTDYDILHCHDMDGMIAGVFSNKKKKPLIFDMHEIYEINGKKQKIRKIIHWLVDWLQKKAQSIIYVVDVQKKLSKENKHRKMFLLPNYPNRTDFSNACKTNSESLRVSYIGSVRQYSELKNLIDASNNLPLEIGIHGAGIAVDPLKKYATGRKNVVISGRFAYSDIMKYYNETDLLYVIYATSSQQYELSYPTKLFEAIITLTPVIVGKGTVLESFVNHYDIGFVVDGDDVNAVKYLLKRLIDTPDIVDGKVANLKMIQYKYCWENVVSILDEIYQ